MKEKIKKRNKDAYVAARICNLEYEDNLNDKNIYKNNIVYKNLNNILGKLIYLIDSIISVKQTINSNN